MLSRRPVLRLFLGFKLKSTHFSRIIDLYSIVGTVVIGMTQTEGLDANKIRELVREVRKPDENSKKITPAERHKRFLKAAQNMWEAFGLKGNFLMEYFEAFLIEAIYLKTKDFVIGDTSSTSMNAARERDSLLTMFGLLQGYYHTEMVDGIRCHVILEARRKKYLQESDFVVLTHSSEKYIDETEENLFNLSRKLLVKHDQETTAPEEQDSFVYFLYACQKNGQLQQILDDGIERFVIKGPGSLHVKYPEPCFTKNNFPLPDSVKIKSDSRPQSAPEPQSTSTNTGKKGHPPKPFITRLQQIPGSTWISFGCLVLFSLSLMLYLGMFRHLSQRNNIIQRISVLNSSVVLSPGEYEQLQIFVYAEDPELEPDWDALQCRSNDAPLIATAKSNDGAESRTWTTAWSVLAAHDWVADLPFYGSVTVEGGEAEDVTVTVSVVEAPEQLHESYFPELPKDVGSASADPTP